METGTQQPRYFDEQVDLGGHVVTATYEQRPGEDPEIVQVQVPIPGGTGLVQIGNADGSEWLLSLGDGWLDEKAPSLKEAVERVYQLGAKYAKRYHGTIPRHPLGQFHELDLSDGTKLLVHPRGLPGQVDLDWYVDGGVQHIKLQDRPDVEALHKALGAILRASR